MVADEFPSLLLLAPAAVDSNFSSVSNFIAFLRNEPNPCHIGVEAVGDTSSPLAAGRFRIARLFAANNCTAIHFVRHDESDFGIGSGSSSFDFVVREELVGRKSRIEFDKDL